MGKDSIHGKDAVARDLIWPICCAAVPTLSYISSFKRKKTEEDILGWSWVLVLCRGLFATCRCYKMLNFFIYFWILSKHLDSLIFSKVIHTIHTFCLSVMYADRIFTLSNMGCFVGRLRNILNFDPIYLTYLFPKNIRLINTFYQKENLQTDVVQYD